MMLQRSLHSLVFLSTLAGCALCVDAARSGSSQADQRQIELGREVFTGVAQPPCAACHTLAEAGAAGTAGPNLDDERPPEDRVHLTITEGVGVMPAYGELLTEEQIEAVAKYVISVAGSSK